MNEKQMDRLDSEAREQRAASELAPSELQAQSARCSVADCSDVWTPERKYWLEQQHAAPHMRGPWVVEERWDRRYETDLIRVVFRTPQIEITIAEWPMRGVQRWSPAYYLMRAHAEMIASAPLYHPNNVLGPTE